MAERGPREGETIIAECNKCGHVFAFAYRAGVEFPQCPECVRMN